MHLTNRDFDLHYTYHPATGILRYKMRQGRQRAGAVVGTKTKGSINIVLKGRHLKAHRIIWERFNGAIPPGYYIDHINHDPCDNRLTNLRLATHADNLRNCNQSKNNTSGYTGVSRNSVKSRRRFPWRARITVDRKEIMLGTFKTAREAYDAYKKAAERYGFHPNHGRTGTIEKENAPS